MTEIPANTSAIPGLALLTKPELAKKLRVSPRTVSNLVNLGMPHLKMGTKRESKILFEFKPCLDWFRSTFARQLGPLVLAVEPAEPDASRVAGLKPDC